MPTFGQTEAGTWHLVGPDGCRYGRAFADNTDRSPANIVMSSNIVAYDLPDTPTATQSSSISGSLSQPSSHSGRFGPRGRTDDQRLVLPTQLQENDSPLCEFMSTTAEPSPTAPITGHHKQATPSRDIDWEITNHDSQQACN